MVVLPDHVFVCFGLRLAREQLLVAREIARSPRQSQSVCPGDRAQADAKTFKGVM